MDRQHLVESVGVAALALLLLTGAVQLNAARERRYPSPVVDDETVYVTSGTTLRRLSGPFRLLAADLYWVRAIQYYGGAKRRLGSSRLAPEPPPSIVALDSPEYSQLYPLLDITTSLDPRFDIAYRFGAIFLAEAYPGGAGRPDLAVKLLEKGLAERPDKWEYMEDIGFVHYWYDHDYRQAADTFAKAAEIPGAPIWLKPLAATTLAQGGDRQSSRRMWQALLQSADIDWVRSAAEKRLLQLRALDEIDELQRRVDLIAQAIQQPVTDWRPLVRSGAFPGIPLDPAGTRYELSPEGRVRLAETSPLFPLPTEPQRLGPS